MSTKHEDLDRLILAKIADFDQPPDFTSIYSGDVAQECFRLADAYNEEKGISRAHFLATAPWRILDRRLQALRRAGKIRYGRRTGMHSRGWIVVKG